jgi:hypothetical protein
LPLLAPSVRPGVRWMEASCFLPPKPWSHRRIFLPPDRVMLRRVSAQELQETLTTFSDLHAVREFGEDGV